MPRYIKKPYVPATPEENLAFRAEYKVHMESLWTALDSQKKTSPFFYDGGKAYRCGQRVHNSCGCRW